MFLAHYWPKNDIKNVALSITVRCDSIEILILNNVCSSQMNKADFQLVAACSSDRLYLIPVGALMSTHSQISEVTLVNII